MKIKNGLKKLFALCLALSMVLGISVPTVANAEDTTPVIEVNNVPEAVIGEMSENKGVDVPEGAKYTATVQWYTLEVLDGVPVRSSFSGTFENKVTYVRELIVTATTDWEGWEYVDEYGEVSVDVVINGEYAGKGWFSEGNNSNMYYETYFNFTEEITSVEITGVMGAVVDAQATTEDIEVPEDANYSVEAQWYTYSDSDGYNEFTGIFEKGKEYELELRVIAKDGYSFSDDCIATIDGEEQDFNPGIAGKILYINKVYSFLEKIDKIEIDNKLPDAVEGQDAEAGVLEVPDDAKYSASYAWFYDDLNNPYVGQFTTGYTYMLAVVVQPAEGCEFAEDVEVTIAGEPVDTPFVTNLGYVYMITETHDLGNNTIDTIEITATEPKAGEKISVDNVKVPEDAKYEILYAAWCNPKTGNELTGTFEEGKQYQLMVVVATDEGVYFANDTKITLNGKEFAGAKFDNNMIAMPFMAVCELGFDLTVIDNNQNNNNQNNNQNNNNTNNNTQNNSNQNTTVTPSPATGDNESLILWIVLAVIAMAGMAVVVSKKRYEV